MSPSKIFVAQLHNKLGIRAHHVLNPIDPCFLDEQPRFEGDGNIIFFGRLEYGKGAHLLVPLAKILNKKIHVVGRGNLEAIFLKNKVPNIDYHGFLPHNEKLRNLIRKVSVVIVPSIVCEMFGYVASEAFALGKPVVAFNHGGLKEQIEASEGGLLVKPFNIKDFAEKVLFLLDNPSEASKLGVKARRWVEMNLRPEGYAKTLDNIYNEAMLS